MRRTRLILIAATGLSLCAAGMAHADGSEVAFGRRIAQRNCGGCHAVGAGRSPNPPSPPFRRLYRRYPPGGLDALLAEGMLVGADRPEEGAAAAHPKMPQVVLGDDETAALKAYLRSLDPRRRRRGPAR